MHRGSLCIIGDEYRVGLHKQIMNVLSSNLGRIFRTIDDFYYHVQNFNNIYEVTQRYFLL